ncbi:MAG: 50S ribosomal protein L4 [Flavobacteriales bacterium]|nr:50S ribosomal protein L4 [Flavobacteriales bacterium]HCA82757.1 50S ribosomal protein L4 [Flavobacteriales bacterium]HRE73233.1 50S ribosomal protein L4 [Flavobacteriales bacterium]HRE98739.1 50S ribosomal protein L4 [Flavobacteriales bacterium]HRJ38438.1 50S ribosomal protein L4 [Flavobacteriales bacterium]
MELEIYNIQGKKTSKKATLSDAIFAAEPNDHAIYLDVKLFLANQRQGTSKTKQRAEVNYSTRKLKRQKGTGGARAGSIKSPLFKQGGNIHGPQPRDYEFKLNKKLKKAARRSALSYKAQEKSILVLEDFKMAAPKTSEFTGILKNLELSGKKTLVVVPDVDHNIYLSSRNLEKSKVVPAAELSTYDIMNANHLVICEGSLQKIENTLNN